MDLTQIQDLGRRVSLLEGQQFPRVQKKMINRQQAIRVIDSDDNADLTGLITVIVVMVVVIVCQRKALECQKR
ncbi:MAG: hypothetical protein HRU11_03295 [Parvularculaceae bacterium]|nr:hypothetical protein [Parvularculaceae bacterium]